MESSAINSVRRLMRQGYVGVRSKRQAAASNKTTPQAHHGRRDRSQEAQCEAVNLRLAHPTQTLAPYISQQPTFFWSETPFRKVHFLMFCYTWLHLSNRKSTARMATYRYRD
jgi:hypothetical protein